jgi:hypothetical protein
VIEFGQPPVDEAELALLVIDHDLTVQQGERNKKFIVRWREFTAKKSSSGGNSRCAA